MHVCLLPLLPRLFKGVIQGLCFIRKQDRTVYSESPIHREYAVRSKLRMCCKALRSAFTFFASTVEVFIIEYVIRKLCACGGAVEANHINKKAAFLLNSTSCVNFNAYINRRQLHNPFCRSAEAKYFEVCIAFLFLDTARCYRRDRGVNVKRTWSHNHLCGSADDSNDITFCRANFISNCSAS